MKRTTVVVLCDHCGRRTTPDAARLFELCPRCTAVERANLDSLVRTQRQLEQRIEQLEKELAAVRKRAMRAITGTLEPNDLLEALRDVVTYGRR